MEFAIYNLYPRLIGSIDNWYSHVDRIHNMGFEWIYVNPIMESGFSGSLYAVKDYYEYNQAFFENSTRLYAEKDIKKFTDHCSTLGINTMLDIVINHSSKDSVLTTEHYNWYKRDEGGNLISPGAWDNGEWVCWGDLAEFDNGAKDDGSHMPLWEYWRDFIDNAMYLGFKGFRCDAAYKVPSELWKYLIDHAKSKDSSVIFFAESLGCSLDDSIALAESGFDYLASSAKWWDYSAAWFVEQYEATRKLTKSITFVENHDTMRTITEYSGNIDRIKQAMIFTASVGNAWVMTYGFEYGARNRCNVVCDTIEHNENIHYDISDYIKRFIDFMKTSKIASYNGELEPICIYGDDLESDEDECECQYQEENYSENIENTTEDDNVEYEYVDEDGNPIDIENENQDDFDSDNENCDEELEYNTSIRAFYKYNDDKTSKLLIVLNTEGEEALFDIIDFNIVADLSFENALPSSIFQQEQNDNRENNSEDNNIITFAPYQIKIFELHNG